MIKSTKKVYIVHINLEEMDDNSDEMIFRVKYVIRMTSLPWKKCFFQNV